MVTKAGNCTCEDADRKKRRKSILERLKFNLFGKKKNESGKIQYLKTSSEEEDVDTSFSRASSGIGTMSTKSKITPEFDDDSDGQLNHSNRDVSDCSIDDSKNPKENIIPVIPRHNFGVFSRHLKYEARAARSSGKNEKKGNNIDKISIAENDDKDFEDFATKEEPDPENEFKVRDWHVMLENDHQSHNETLENEDVNVKYKSFNQDKKTPERIAARRRHQHKDARHTKNRSFNDESEHERENFLNIKNADPEYSHENTLGQCKEDLSDCSSKEDSKPAKKTLKKTFTSLLSKIQLGKLSTDGSSVTDTDSNCDISRRPGKKSFMYFASSAGRGFIISDDEEITGVISVRNKKNGRTRTSSFRNKISDTINDTLKRKKKIKRASEPIDFLYVNRPDFSSNESINLMNGDVKKNFRSEISHFVNV